MKYGAPLIVVLLLSLAPLAFPTAHAAEDATNQTETAADRALSPEMQALADKVRRTLAVYHARQLNTRDHGPWEIMHSTLGQGIESQVLADGPSGDPVTAIGWLCFNRPAYGQRLFHLSGDRLAPRVGPGLQGHEGQLLAVLAQSRVKSDYPIRASGREFTVADLVAYEKATCMAGTELTFKLIGLMHYLPSDATWKNEIGETWNIERLIREEIAQPIQGATCGGTHRLMGLSYAVRRREERDEPITGEFARAKKYVEDYVEYALRLQNSDGSFSTDYFASRASDNDDLLRLESTGHVLEWVAFALPETSLARPNVVKSVDYLADLLLKTEDDFSNAGALGHAVRGLLAYERRMFGDRPATASGQQSTEKQARR